MQDLQHVTVINPFCSFVCGSSLLTTKFNAIHMDDPERYVGRWVLLYDVPGNKKLDGAHAEVISYHSKDETFEIRLFSIGTDTLKCIRVETSCLVFYPDFKVRFPQAPVIKYRPKMPDFPDEAVVIDFTDLNPELSLPKPDEVILRNHPCKFKGNGMKISRKVWIELKDNGTDIVEFEGIHFAPVQYQKQTINCVRGEVLFLSCSFSYNPIGVTVGPESSATFENCSFQECNECGVRVEGDNRVQFINCKFYNNGIGVWVDEKALVNVAGCTIAGCIGGVLLPFFSNCKVRHTTFDNMEDYCVLASNRSALDFRECVIKGCKGDGLVYEAGGIDSTFVAEDSIITNCRAAVRIGNGRVDVVLKELELKKCSIGIYIAADTVGRVWFQERDDYGIDDCQKDILRLESDKCRFMYDGIQLTDRHGSQVDRLKGFQTIFSANGIKYGYPVSAFTKRMLHKTGIASIQCANCKVSPATDAWFKKCNECKEARYCSRDCQRAHYKAHRVECFVTTVKAYEMSTRGYICCMHCGAVESETSGKQHKACSQCLAVFYCSRKCQVANWKEHKTSCKQRFS